MNWIGPFTIEEILDHCLDESFPKPPDKNSVYLISLNLWERCPSENCVPLYVGSNTGKGARFRTRIGDLIVDMFGFYQSQSGHSSGGKSLHNYCKDKKINPKNLYIAWLDECTCGRCSELEWYNLLAPKLNKKSPPSCRQPHSQCDVQLTSRQSSARLLGKKSAT